MRGHPDPSSHVSLLRALLFTDLCDSARLVERLGDAAAVELFQQHDRLVLSLQQRWNGQQIDRSDGLFLLFERPAAALGFALDYQQGLRGLGTDNAVSLRARTGLHVGEVILWGNSAEAVALGSKAVEVEGLAKPMTARLMQMARPGQILLSATAASAVRAGIDELGTAGRALAWTDHGRWRLKGLAQPMAVCGVQAATMPGVGRPQATAKATPDLPFWRRPVGRVAQATLVLLLGVGVWLLARPPPAVAFAERDWVVIGQLRNLTGNTLLDDSLEQALRISLEQSSYVNVLSEEQVSRTRTMMRRLPYERLDRHMAAAIAERTGARLVLMPSVVTVAGRARFAVDVVDPRSQRTLATAAADAKAGRLLAAVDEVSWQLRDRVGEQAAAIGRSSMPLPEVSTSSLDALRAYALGQARYSRGDYSGASAFYAQATRIDPAFALAWLGQARCRFAAMDFRGAARLLGEASRRAAHLTPREALYVENWALQIDDPDRATDGWMRMAELYPDYMPAVYNAGLNLFHENRMDDALRLARRAARGRVDLPAVAQDQYGRVLLAMGDYAAADAALARASAKGWSGALMRQASVAAAGGHFGKARALLDRIDPGDYHADLFAATIALDQGDLVRATRLAERGLQRSAGKRGMDRYNFDVPLAVMYMATGDRRRARQIARQGAVRPLQDLDGQPAVDVIDRVVAAQAAALVALRLGDEAPARALAARMRGLAGLPDSKVVRQFSAVLEAETLRRQGRPQGALDLLLPYLDRQPRLQLRVAARDAARAAGRHDLALEQTRWLRGRAGFAYAEAQCSFCLQALNVLDVRAADDDAAGMPVRRAFVAADQRRVRGVPWPRSSIGTE